MPEADRRTIYEKSRPGRRAFTLPALDVPEVPLDELVPATQRRAAPARLPEVSEIELLRHYTGLSALYFLDARPREEARGYCEPGERRRILSARLIAVRHAPRLQEGSRFASRAAPEQGIGVEALVEPDGTRAFRPQESFVPRKAEGRRPQVA